MSCMEQKRRGRSGASKRKRRRLAQDFFSFAYTLARAASLHDFEGCHRLLEEGHDPNAIDERGYSPLLCLLDDDGASGSAAAVEIAELLVSYGADMNYVHFNGSTFLLEAAETNNTEVAKFALRRGADFSTRTYWGRSIAHIAVYHRNTEMLKELLGQPEFSIDIFDDHGASPVLTAAENGYLNVLKLFVERCGKEIVVKLANIPCGDDNLNALSAAVNEGHSDVVRFLLHLGVDPNVPYFYTWDDEKKGTHVVALAASKGFSRCLAPLLLNPLCIAASNGRYECLELLLESGYDPNVERELVAGSGFVYTDFVRPIFQREYCTPLKEATQRRHEDCVRLLIKHGAKMTYDEDVHSPFLYSLRSWSDTKVFECYLENDVDLNVISKDSALHIPDALLTCLTEPGYGYGKLNRLLDAGVKVNLEHWCGCKGGYSLIDTLAENKNNTDSVEALVTLVSRYAWRIPNCCDKVAKMTSKPMGEVPRLLHLARHALRAAMPPKRLIDDSYVQKLPLPPHLKNYVAFHYKNEVMCNSKIRDL
ncbi:hypothetical protein QR680_016846 [Steinernema hermaphroditum]|uniref:SOCS box domain-containing protein n=1 Tax=Steinernema hermaphroditum TaxID=289476 RepID=A0AA39HEL7_9BILA|nr:hypothetical protein QR680_016846 [Steinernema hermaphroditum]